MNQRRLLLLALLLVAVLVVGLLVPDARFSSSETETQSSVGTSQLGEATAPLDRPVSLLVLGEGPIADGIGADLAAELEPRFPSVSVIEDATPGVTGSDASAAQKNGSVLVVAVRNHTTSYTPVRATGEVAADFAYVGSRNVSFATGLVTEEQMIVTNEEPYVVRGEVTVRDRSRGLFSVPGYRNHLREALAETLREALLSAPGMDA